MDLSFTDEQRADPVVVLDYWRQSELFSAAELDQVESLFAATDPEDALAAAASIGLDPESDPVANAVSVFFASWDYWSTNGAGFEIDSNGRIVQGCGDDDGCVHELRVVYGDVLGGLIGGLMGGLIGAAIVSGGLSTAFVIDQGCWPDPCTGDTQLPPAPCGGYTGIGPCPD